jgi:hypothetical protein
MTLSRRTFLRGAGGACAALTTLPAILSDPSSAQTDQRSESGGNPIVTGVGLCDPQVRIYDNHAYLYATHDASPDNKGFVMNDWWVWHSKDLVHWEQVSTLRPEQTYWGKPSTECWATDAMHRNGQYYFYFSRGPEEIGVVQSDSPVGPWHDPIGKPLIAKGSTPTQARDPGILQEEDGTSYIVFGVWDFYIARLGEDMVSLAETPRKIELDRKMGPYGSGMMDDKPFLHRRKGIYYLSWGCYYAMSDNVYGPYVYKDSIIKPDHVAPVFRDRLIGKEASSFVDASGAKHLVDFLTLDRHASFFELHGQSYYICNDQAWPGTQSCFRDSVISYLHYRDNGEMETVELSRTGVGQYDAHDSVLPAANYFATESTIVAQCPEGGYEVRGISNVSSLTYPNIRNFPTRASIQLRASCSYPHATVEFYSDASHPEPLLSLNIQATGSLSSYRTFTGRLRDIRKISGLHLRFKTVMPNSLRIQWLRYT